MATRYLPPASLLSADTSLSDNSAIEAEIERLLRDPKEDRRRAFTHKFNARMEREAGLALREMGWN